MASISVDKAWDQTRDFIKRERRLITPVVMALVFLPTLLFRLFVPQPSFAEMMAGNYPAWMPLVSYALLFVQLVAGATLILMVLGSRDAVGETLAKGLKRALIVLLAIIIGAVVAGMLLLVLMLVAALLTGVPTDPTAMPPAFVGIAALLSIGFLMLIFRCILTVPAAVAEPIGPLQALKRGWALGRGSGFKLVATMLLLILAAMVVNYVVTTVLGAGAAMALGGSDGASLGGIVVSLAVAAIGAVIFVIQYVMIANLYRQAAAA